MKPFDLELARQGKPVCTKNGKPVRIVCFDRNHSLYPLIVLIKDGDKEELDQYTSSGKKYAHGSNSEADLRMISEKKEGWINIYRCGNGEVRGCSIWSSKDEAIKNTVISDSYVTTTRIEWEE